MSLPSHGVPTLEPHRRLSQYASSAVFGIASFPYIVIHRTGNGTRLRPVSRSQLALLAVTENYLRETYDAPFWLIAPP